MKTRILLFMTALVLTFSSQAQTVITVDNTEGADADYSDLQSAVSNANSGDIIYVHASETNYLDVTINNSLTLIGFSHSDADKETMIRDITFGPNSSDTRVTGFHITDDFIVDNVNTVTNLVIENNLFDSNVASAIIFIDGGADDVLFRGNIINAQFGSNTASSGANNVTNAIFSENIIMDNMFVKFHESVTLENNIFLDGSRVFNLDSDTGDLEIEDCIIYVSSGGVFDPNNTGVTFSNCLSYNDLSGVTNLAGSGNINDTDPEFVSADNDVFDALTDDYTLQPTSPALGMGVDGDDIGLYSANSNFTFNNFGFTVGIPTVTITSITTQVEQGGDLSVTIQSNSN